MKLIHLHPKDLECLLNDKLSIAYSRLENLIALADTKPLSANACEKINAKIQELNETDKINGALYRLVNLTENEIINILEADISLVPAGYYSKKWLAIGMGIIGVPIGILLGTLTKNMGLISIGIPVGMGLGALIGRAKDAQAAKEGRQYNLSEPIV